MAVDPAAGSLLSGVSLRSRLSSTPCPGRHPGATCTSGAVTVLDFRDSDAAGDHDCRDDPLSPPDWDLQLHYADPVLPHTGSLACPNCIYLPGHQT